MVSLPQHSAPAYMTEAEYLAFEEQSEVKHEFVNGEVYAMTGGSVRHNLIANQTGASLIRQLLDKDCIVPSNDTRIKVQSKVAHRYPDVTVICGQIDYFDNRVDTVTNPIVLIEVLSHSTEIIDRNDKFNEYTQLSSLQEYVLISQDTPQIERFLRQESGDWLYTRVIGIDGILELPSIDCQLVLADVYRKVELTDDTQ